MDRVKKLKIANLFLLISSVIQAIAGLLLLSPSASETIAEIHKYNGVAIIILIIIHLAFNWEWVKKNLSP
jgi:hypothetical protein